LLFDDLTRSFTVTTRIAVVLVVTFVSACGASARSPTTASTKTAEAASHSNTKDDYVVGPFVSSQEDGEETVRTYYIVRN
jgi:hypothetical protein